MDLNAVLQEVLTLSEQGKDPEALRRLELVADDIPDTFEHHKLVGMLYQRLCEDTKSMEHLRQAMERNPQDPMIHQAFGVHYLDNGKPEWAAASFRESLALDQRCAKSHHYLGRALDDTGSTGQALEAFERARILDPGNIQPLLYRGKALLRAHRFSEAEKTFVEALRTPLGHPAASIGKRRAEWLSANGPPRTKTGYNGQAATIVSVKQGDYYGADYVNRLASMIARHAGPETRFVCFTEDTGGIDPAVECLPLLSDTLTGWWQKVTIFMPELPGLSGRLLYLDLDIAIVDDLSPLLHYDSGFAIADEDYTVGFNSSVFLFEAGSFPHVWSSFTKRERSIFPRDQDWIAYNLPEADLWPNGWCITYRMRARDGIPSGTKVVYFQGKPKPHDYPSSWVRDHWR